MKTLILLLLTLFLTYSASAAEIRLRTETVRTMSDFITLDDVAEVTATQLGENLAALKEAILFAAPAPGEVRHLDVVELRTILSSLGMSPTQNSVFGKSVTIIGEEQFVERKSHARSIQQVSYTRELSPQKLSLPDDSQVYPRQLNHPAPQENSIPYQADAPKSNAISPQFLKLLETQLHKALAVALDRYLSDRNSSHPWKINFSLTNDQAMVLATSGQIREIVGIVEPLEGLQHFVIVMEEINSTVQNGTEPMPVTIGLDATVTRLQEVVLFRRALSRGHIINEDDLVLRASDHVRTEDYYTDISDVLGMETTKSVKETEVVSASVLKRPLMVRKGELVTVVAKFAGGQIKTQGTALQDGSSGETISVQPVSNESTSRNRRQRPQDMPAFLAQISGPRTVEVDSSAMQIF